MRYVVLAYYWWWEYIWWLQPVSISERCSYDGGLDYTVVLENSSGERVDEKVVSSNNCSAGLCSISFSLSSSDENYLVSISVNNTFGLSNITTSTIISEFTLCVTNYIVVGTGGQRGTQPPPPPQYENQRGPAPNIVITASSLYLQEVQCSGRFKWQGDS